MNLIGLNCAYWKPTWDSDPLPFVSRTRSCGFDILEINAQRVVEMTDKERDVLIIPDGDALREMPVYRDLLGDNDPEEEATRSLRFLRTELAKYASKAGGDE
jgi:hypothetical protein